MSRRMLTVAGILLLLVCNVSAQTPSPEAMAAARKLVAFDERGMVRPLLSMGADQIGQGAKIAGQKLLCRHAISSVAKGTAIRRSKGFASTPLAHEPRLVAIPVARLLGLTLVV